LPVRKSGNPDRTALHWSRSLAHEASFGHDWQEEKQTGTENAFDNDRVGIRPLSGAFALMKSRAITAVKVLAAWFVLTSSASATIVYESATLGATGAISGHSISATQFVGARFSVASTTDVSSIGGHIYGIGGSIFGAIVALPGAGGIPTGHPFAAGELLASGVFSPTRPSSEQSLPLSATLLAGHYALIFGSGILGATGEAAVVDGAAGASVIGDPSYLFWNGQTWQNAFFGASRLFVQAGPAAAAAIPEPATLTLVVLGLAALALRRRATVATSKRIRGGG
jgi:hypothetical protein